MKKGIARKLALAGIAATTAITLAACSSDADNGDGGESEDGKTSSTVNGGGKDAEDQPAEDENGLPNQVVVKDDKVNDITSVTNEFYMELLTKPVEGGNEAIIQAQDDMTLAVDGDTSVFEAANPVDSIATLSDDKQNSLVEVTSKYSDGVRDATNYNDLTKPEQATINMVSLVFRGNATMSGFETEGLKITIDPEAIEVDKDTATVKSSGVTFSQAGEDGEVVSESDIITIDTPLVKTKDGWKVDGAEFINRLMSQTAAE